MASGADARLMVEAMEKWVGKAGKPFALLTDCARLESTDADYRAIWADFFKKHRLDGMSALFHVEPQVIVSSEMFAQGTGMALRAFADEASARAWLREKGIEA